MEITAKMKDKVIEWMAIQEKAVLNCDLTLETENGTIVLECLGYINGVKALHLHDIRPMMMILGIDESEANYTFYGGLEYEFCHRYDITIGQITYYSLYKELWGSDAR